VTQKRTTPPVPPFTSLVHGPGAPQSPEHITRAQRSPTHPRVCARGTRRDEIHPGDQIRTLIFAPEATRAAWIEGELSRAPISITIQIGRRVRTVVSALVRDPPPRPQVLIVDFDAVSPDGPAG